MPRQTIPLTSAFQQISATNANIRIISASSGAVVAFNEIASDTNAFVDKVEPGDQFLQNEDKPTFARITAGSDVSCLIDEEG